MARLFIIGEEKLPSHSPMDNLHLQFDSPNYKLSYVWSVTKLRAFGHNSVFSLLLCTLYLIIVTSSICRALLIIAIVDIYEVNTYYIENTQNSTHKKVI